jgi:hypothetical protein
VDRCPFLEEFAEEIAVCPFVRRCLAIMDLVGDERQVTSEGFPCEEDVRELALRTGTGPATGRWAEATALHGPWTVLLHHKWLEIDRGTVRPGGLPRLTSTLSALGLDEPDATGPSTPGPVEVLPMSMLVALATWKPWQGGLINPQDTLDAVLVCTTADGLTLPRVPDLPLVGIHEQRRLRASLGPLLAGADGSPEEPAAASAPLPAIRRKRVANVTYDLDLLVSHGLVDKQGQTYRTPRYMLRIIKVALDALADSAPPGQEWGSNLPFWHPVRSRSRNREAGVA